MPFFVYEKIPSPGGDVNYLNPRRETRIPSALSAYFIAQNPHRTYPFEWHRSDEEILSLLGNPNPASHSIVIDLRPNDSARVSLYTLCDGFGFCQDAWYTVLGLKLRPLFCETSDPSPTHFKQSFSIPDSHGAASQTVREFLYLVRAGKSWRWGQVGRVNAALLGEQAWGYFVRIM